MMTRCEENGFPCQNPDYAEFDNIAKMELLAPISANVLVNNSKYCMPIPVNDDFSVGDIGHKLFLKALSGQSGLYHLWIDHDDCDDHGTHTMLCVYVGKGPPDTRIDSHIKTKWPNAVKLYVTFTQMDNRLAKYYEQLFLDTYNFHLNKSENRGLHRLYSVWDNERYTFGTHLNEISGLSKMQNFEDW
jgi:hypothetical protein